MNLNRAKELLGDAIQPDGSLFSLGWYLAWKPGYRDAVLDGEFSIEDLEAIVWHARFIEALLQHNAEQALAKDAPC